MPGLHSLMVVSLAIISSLEEHGAYCCSPRFQLEPIECQAACLI